MALNTYLDFIAAINNWLARDDLASVGPDLIRLAENRIQRELKLRAFESSVTDVVSGSLLTLPEDCLEPRMLTLNGKTVEIVSSDRGIKETTASGAAQPIFAYSEGLGMRLCPAPDSDYSYTLIYQARIPPLGQMDQEGNTVTENWLTQNAPDLLLYACLLEAAPFIGDDPRMGVWQAQFDRAALSMRKMDWRAKTGGGTLRLRPDRVA